MTSALVYEALLQLGWWRARLSLIWHPLPCQPLVLQLMSCVLVSNKYAARAWCCGYWLLDASTAQQHACVNAANEDYSNIDTSILCILVPTQPINKWYRTWWAAIWLLPFVLPAAGIWHVNNWSRCIKSLWVSLAKCWSSAVALVAEAGI